MLAKSKGGIFLLPHGLQGNFKVKFFACPCCGMTEVDDTLIVGLEKLRIAVRKDFHVTCGCRCESHNKAVGGAPKSAHVMGLAADIQNVDINPETFFFEAVKLFSGVGIYNGKVGPYLHVDTEISTKRPKLWYCRNKYDVNGKKISSTYRYFSPTQASTCYEQFIKPYEKKG